MRGAAIHTQACVRQGRRTEEEGMKNEVDKRGGGEDTGSHTQVCLDNFTNIICCLLLLQSDTKDDKEEKKDGVGGRDKPQVCKHNTLLSS